MYKTTLLLATALLALGTSLPARADDAPRHRMAPGTRCHATCHRPHWLSCWRTLCPHCS